MIAKTVKPVTAKKTRILLVDDHPIVRQGLGMLIAQQPDMAVCGESDDVAGALRLIDQTPPDVIIVDLTLKESTGLDLIKDVRLRHPGVLTLVYSMRDESFYAERVLRAGARGYITKEEGGKAVIEGIRKILQGQIFLSERMASKMIGLLVGSDGPAATPSVKSLTDRELEIFELIGQGLPTRTIASQLHVSPKTVESYREHIKRKLKLDNASQLLKHAIEWVQHSSGNIA
ncbi:MAG: response regulator transcription factor [Phycisphaerae bacterium]|jgi:DNA-binding NarL/FixJ family response regulator